MRSLSFVATLLFALLLVVQAYPILPPADLMSAPSSERRVALLDYNVETSAAKFTLSRHATTENAEDDDALVFDIQVPLNNEGVHDRVVLNGRSLPLAWSNDLPESTHLISVADKAAGVHTASISISTIRAQAHRVPPHHASQTLRFHLLSLDDELVDDLGFDVVTRPDSSSIRSIIVEKSRAVVNVARPASSSVSSKSDPKHEMHDHTSFDLANEAESLRLLELEAHALHSEITAKRIAIATHLKQHRDEKSLKHLIEECDGLVCAAKVVAQRICDRIGDHSPQYAKHDGPHVQQLIALDDNESTTSETTVTQMTHSRVQAPGGRPHPAHLPLIVTHSGPAHSYSLNEIVHPTNPLTRALQLLASAIGLLALFQFIRKRCMSMRKRVDRAADREERRNARAYRRAARRALMHQRWNNFVAALNCFRAAPEPRNEDYEEKRALILQDAFLENLDDLDSAEKGDVMEAEIRELRHAHQIVASLIRVNGDDLNSRYLVRDPPPSRVPLPFTPTARSRASSATLPSYTSECLPDYTSRPATLAPSSIVDTSSASTPGTLDSQPPSLSGDEDNDSYDSPPSTASYAGPPRSVNLSVGRCTSTSSIIDISPRPSAETIRTLISRSTGM